MYQSIQPRTRHSISLWFDGYMINKWMTHKPVLNREGALPDDGWYHIAPIGEFAVTSGGKRVMQVIDDKAVQAMAGQSIPGDTPLLVDYEHFSYDPEQSSEAAGWIRELQARPDGLYARIEWTDTGSVAVTNKRYLFVSPVWYPDECEQIAGGKIRPLRLDSIALTNKPNLRGMRPLSNRGTEEQAQDIRAGENTMNELKALLGLADTATDTDIVAAVKALKTSAEEVPALKNRATTAETKITAMETAQLDADANAFCEKNAAIIANRDQVKAQFIANRAGTEALFANIKPAATKTDGKPPVFNRQKSGTDAEAVTEADNTKAAAIRNRANEIMTQRKCTWGVAFDAAKSESN